MDGFRKKVRWRRQHDPTLLENGHFLLFDNRGHMGRSKVVEFDPLTGETFWQYYGASKEEFYSDTCGTSYRLRNGNTLIVETEAGRAFEITPGKNIVWEFYNPHRTGDNDELIAMLLDLIRVDGDYMQWENSGERG